MRAVLALLLALILGLASQAEAVARSEMAGATLQAACGTGQVMLDALGKPMAAHSCTHCLAASVAPLDAVAPLPQRPRTAALTLRPDQTAPGQGRPLPSALARGPPAIL